MLKQELVPIVENNIFIDPEIDLENQSTDFKVNLGSNLDMKAFSKLELTTIPLFEGKNQEPADIEFATISEQMNVLKKTEASPKKSFTVEAILNLRKRIVQSYREIVPILMTKEQRQKRLADRFPTNGYTQKGTSTEFTRLSNGLNFNNLQKVQDTKSDLEKILNGVQEISQEQIDNFKKEQSEKLKNETIAKSKIEFNKELQQVRQKVRELIEAKQNNYNNIDSIEMYNNIFTDFEKSQEYMELEKFVLLYPESFTPSFIEDLYNPQKIVDEMNSQTISELASNINGFSELSKPEMSDLNNYIDTTSIIMKEMQNPSEKKDKIVNKPENAFVSLLKRFGLKTNKDAIKTEHPNQNLDKELKTIKKILSYKEYLQLIDNINREKSLMNVQKAELLNNLEKMYTVEGTKEETLQNNSNIVEADNIIKPIHDGETYEFQGSGQTIEQELIQLKQERKEKDISSLKLMINKKNRLQKGKSLDLNQEELLWIYQFKLSYPNYSVNLPHHFMQQLADFELNPNPIEVKKINLQELQISQNSKIEKIYNKFESSIINLKDSIKEIFQISGIVTQKQINEANVLVANFKSTPIYVDFNAINLRVENQIQAISNEIRNQKYNNQSIETNFNGQQSRLKNLFETKLKMSRILKELNLEDDIQMNNIVKNLATKYRQENPFAFDKIEQRKIRDDLQKEQINQTKKAQTVVSQKKVLQPKINSNFANKLIKAINTPITGTPKLFK